MISTSEKYKANKYSTDVKIEGALTLSNGNTVNITDENIVQGSLAFKESAVSGGFGVGGVIADQLDIGIMLDLENPFLLSSAEIKLKSVYDLDGESQSIPIGLFYIDDSSVSRSKNTVSFTAYNGMINFDKPVPKSKVFTKLTPYQLLSAACTACGMTLANTQTQINAMPNGMKTFSLKKDDSAITYRDLLAYVLQIIGAFGRINRESGKLEIVRFSASEDFIINEDTAVSRTVSDTPVMLSGVKYDETLKGSEGFVIDLSGNPMLAGCSKSELSAVLDSLLKSDLKNLKLYNADVTWFGDLSVQAGDCFTYAQEGLYGGDRKIIVMENEWRKSGKCVIKSYGDNTSSTYSPVSKVAMAMAETVNFIKANYILAKTVETEYLKAEQADISFAKITELTAANAKISSLTADTANIKNILAGDIGTGDLLTINLTAENATVSSQFAKDIIAKQISVGDLLAGTISTNKFTIVSDSGNVKLYDNTLLIKDGTRARVQIGKDANGDYSMYVWDSNGKLMFDALDGLHADGIKSGIIRDDMVADNAHISGGKIDMESLFSAMNDSEYTISSSKVFYDDEGQTLQVAFNNLKTSVSTANVNANSALSTANTVKSELAEVKSNVTSQGTQLNIVQGQISSKVWQSDILTAVNNIDSDITALNNKTTTLTNQYSTLEQNLTSITATVAKHTTDISQKADNTTVSALSSNVTQLTADLSGFKSTVSSTYTTKTEFNNLEVGGRNLLTNSKLVRVWYCAYGGNAIHSVSRDNGTYIVNGQEIKNPYKAAWKNGGSGDMRISRTQNTNSDALTTSENVSLANKTYTFSIWLYVDVACSITCFITRTYQDSDRTSKVFSLAANKWTKIVMTKTYSSREEIDGIRIRFTMAGVTTNMLFALAKLEEGNKSTDWTPAPEDIDSDITALEDRVATAETSITQNTSNIALRATKTEVTNAISTAAADATTKANNALANAKSYADAQITVSADSITNTVSKTYATQTTVNGMQSSISTMQSSISQNASEISHKVSKDSIISEINQSPEQVTINASKINIAGFSIDDEKLYTVSDGKYIVINNNRQINAAMAFSSPSLTNHTNAALRITHSGEIHSLKYSGSSSGGTYKYNRAALTQGYMSFVKYQQSPLLEQSVMLSGGGIDFFSSTSLSGTPTANINYNSSSSPALIISSSGGISLSGGSRMQISGDKISFGGTVSTHLDFANNYGLRWGGNNSLRYVSSGLYGAGLYLGITANSCDTYLYSGGDTHIYAGSGKAIKLHSPTYVYSGLNIEGAAIDIANNYGITCGGNTAFRWYSNALYCGISSAPLKLIGSSVTSNGSTVTSDERLKNHIEPIDDRYLQLLDVLDGKKYFYNDYRKTTRNCGFTAQDLLKGMSEVGLTADEFGAFCDVYGNGSEYAIDYMQFIPILWEIVKKLKAEISAIKEEI